jgi:hypothetical protein
MRVMKSNSRLILFLGVISAAFGGLLLLSVKQAQATQALDRLPSCSVTAQGAQGSLDMGGISCSGAPTDCGWGRLPF